MKRKKKRTTPEELEWRARSEARIKQLRELVARGEAELAERRKREAAAGPSS